jgi:hypothetical protein
LRALRLLAICTLMVALLIGMAAAQTGSANNSKPAANAWMLIPTPYLERNRGISSEIRAERDQYMDQITPPVFALPLTESARRLPLTSPGKHEYVTPSGCDGAASGREIQDRPGRAVATATFTGHSSVLSATEYSLYSEITLRVGQVFEDRSGSQHLSPGQEITVVVTGGTVRLPSGRTVTYETSPREWSLQPDHSYLLVLSYYKEGDFWFYFETWDVSDGSLRPADCRTDYWARSGRSSLTGLTVQQLGPALGRILYPNQ